MFLFTEEKLLYPIITGKNEEIMEISGSAFSILIGESIFFYTKIKKKGSRPFFIPLMDFHLGNKEDKALILRQQYR